MAKARRERDRPKAAPDALYNPNKRVRLCYDTESEGEEEGDGKEQTTAGASGTASKRDGDNALAATVRSELEDTFGRRLQSNKALQAIDGEEEVDEEAYEEEYDAEQSKVSNAATGQWHALGSLAWQDEGDDGVAEEDEAMQYLRSVRAERQNLPAVLNSSGTQARAKRKIEDTGFDVGEAFVGAPSIAPSPASDAQRSGDPREVYTAALKARFLRQREQFRVPPPAEAIAALDEKHLVADPLHGQRAKAEWLLMLTSVSPMPAQVAALDEDLTYRLLDISQQHVLGRGKDINRVSSAWIWSLLARLEDVGMMNNDQVYNVRSFGKKAVLVLVSFRSSEAARQLEALADGEGAAQSKDEAPRDDMEPSEEVHEASVARRENTLATLDAILVVVGDIFRQRDLLEHRRTWEVEDGEVTGS